MSPDHRRFWHRRDVEKQLGPLAEAPEKEAKDESTRDFPRVGFLHFFIFFLKKFTPTQKGS